MQFGMRHYKSYIYINIKVNVPEGKPAPCTNDFQKTIEETCAFVCLRMLLIHTFVICKKINIEKAELRTSQTVTKPIITQM